MPLTLSSAAIAEKNKLVSSGAWILFLKIEYPGETPIHVCDNNTPTVWAGQSWIPVTFALGDIEESKDGDIPKTTLSIDDITRSITPLLDEYAGGVNSQVTVSVCHSSNLLSAIPEDQHVFSLLDTSIDSKNRITFSLGAENLLNYRFPQDRFLKNHCRYKEFKGDLCGYAGEETTCDRSFTQCRSYGNQVRFGGFPSIGRVGIFK